MKVIRIGSLHVCLSDIRGVSEFVDAEDYFGFTYVLQGVSQFQTHECMLATFRDSQAPTLSEAQILEVYNQERVLARGVHAKLLAEWTKVRSTECRFCIKW